LKASDRVSKRPGRGRSRCCPGVSSITKDDEIPAARPKRLHAFCHAIGAPMPAQTAQVRQQSRFWVRFSAERSRLA
jgi:hypothetical protein